MKSSAPRRVKTWSAPGRLLFVASCFIVLVTCVTGVAMGTDESAVDNAQDVSKEIDQLKRDLASMRDKIDHRPKDVWDKFGAISGLVSGILVAFIGFYATQVYNQRQRLDEDARKERELATIQVQTVEKFFVHLSSGDEAKKEAALQAIAALGNAELATKLAVTFRGSGSISALTRIASSPSPTVAKAATLALGDLYSSVRPSVVRIEAEGRVMATGFFVTGSGMLVTTAHVAESLESGRAQVMLSDGTRVSGVVVKVDRERDLALLKADIKGSAVPLRIAPVVSAVVLGEQVVGLGQSAEQGWVASVGDVVSVGVATAGLSGEHIGVTLMSRPGFSGAPVLNTQGVLVGVVRASAPDPNLTFLIAASEVSAAFSNDLARAQ